MAGMPAEEDDGEGALETHSLPGIGRGGGAFYRGLLSAARAAWRCIWTEPVGLDVSITYTFEEEAFTLDMSITYTLGAEAFRPAHCTTWQVHCER